MQILLNGLTGGHSGAEIHKGLGNYNKIIFDILPLWTSVLLIFNDALPAEPLSLSAILPIILFNDFNDSIEDAKNLYSFTKHTPSKVNIIEYNPIENGQYEKSSDLRMNHFISFLENKGVVIKVRRSRGKDIDAACCQLANKKSLKN